MDGDAINKRQARAKAASQSKNETNVSGPTKIPRIAQEKHLEGDYASKDPKYGL